MQETPVQNLNITEELEALVKNRITSEELPNIRTHYDTAKRHYIEVVKEICSLNKDLAKYQTIIIHDVNNQFNTIVNKLQIDVLSPVEDFDAFIKPEIKALGKIITILNTAEENPDIRFNIQDLSESIFVPDFAISTNNPDFNFNIVTLFSIRTLILNARNQKRGELFKVKLELDVNDLNAAFRVYDNATGQWSEKNLLLWKENYRKGFEESNLITEIENGGGGLVAFTAGQRAEQFKYSSEIGSDSLVKYVNSREQNGFKYVEVTFPFEAKEMPSAA